MDEELERRRQRKGEKKARRADRYEQNRRFRRAEGMAAQKRWTADRSSLIRAFERAGHVLAFTSQRHGTTEGVSGATFMRCEECGAKYRGRFLGRWWGLSAKRPCKGDDSG